MTKAITPSGINHIVLNVRDIERSHRFWTEIIGFVQVGALKPKPSRPNPPKMRFYSCDHAGKLSHHDLALMENPSLPPRAGDADKPDTACAVAHVAVALPSREAWLAQLAHLQASGIKFDRRVEHGMTHSVYIHDPDGYGIEVLYELPREVWEDDIEAAQNYAIQLPTEGAAALEDRIEGLPVFKRQPVQA